MKKAALKKKSKPKTAAQPRYIMDGNVLYIHVGDLIDNLKHVCKLGVGIGPAVEVLRIWRDEKVKK